ncbi:MAG: hypothetical protein HONBIEJF_01885 [Fimbriimonadaceae bacterium]|nr:hypothetical protein [Fimbriimonadaceae bacterium]
MARSARLLFKSTMFPIQPGEDQSTNPGIYGKTLAEWLMRELRQRGVPAIEVDSEDFGWWIEIESKPNSMAVYCGSIDGETDAWWVMAKADGRILDRILKRDQSRDRLENLYAQLKSILGAEARITEIAVEQD